MTADVGTNATEKEKKGESMIKLLPLATTKTFVKDLRTIKPLKNQN